MKKNPKILFIGAGAIGGSTGAWLASKYDNVFFYDRGDTAQAIRKNGITLYQHGRPDDKLQFKVRVIDDLKSASNADIAVLAVKSYDLESAVNDLKVQVGDKPVIIAMQNGIDNQIILPHYFSKVIYCVIGYNAWVDTPGVIGYQKKGPLIFGTKFNEMQEDVKEIARLFSTGVKTIPVTRLQDAVHSKIIINLANSLYTLIGYGFEPISDPGLFQKVLTNLLYDGVRTVRAAGFKQCTCGGMPSWGLIWLGAKMPQSLTRPLFNKKARQMVISSMSQDVIQRGTRENELETIHGYLVKLADKHNIKTPYLTSIYEMCKNAFSQPVFKPVDIADVWAKIQ